MNERQVDPNKLVYFDRNDKDLNALIDMHSDLDDLNIQVAQKRTEIKKAITKFRRKYELSGLDEIDLDRGFAVPFEKPDQNAGGCTTTARKGVSDSRRQQE